MTALTLYEVTEKGSMNKRTQAIRDQMQALKMKNQEEQNKAHLAKTCEQQCTSLVYLSKVVGKLVKDEILEQLWSFATSIIDQMIAFANGI